QLQISLIDLDTKERRNHRFICSLANRARFVVSEAGMRRETAIAYDRLNRAIEDVNEPIRVFAMSVATHRGLVHGDLAASRFEERYQFVAHNRQQDFGDVETVEVFSVRQQSPAQSVRPRHARFERDCGLGLRDCRLREALQSFPFFNNSQTARRAQFAGDSVFTALIVRGRPETARQSLFQSDSFQKTEERQVKIERRLLAISDHVKTGGDLVVNRRNHRVFLQFSAIRFAELIQMLAGEFEPTWERVAADNSGSEWELFQLILR